MKKNLFFIILLTAFYLEAKDLKVKVTNDLTSSSIDVKRIGTFKSGKVKEQKSVAPGASVDFKIPQSTVCCLDVEGMKLRPDVHGSKKTDIHFPADFDGLTIKNTSDHDIFVMVSYAKEYFKIPAGKGIVFSCPLSVYGTSLVIKDLTQVYTCTFPDCDNFKQVTISKWQNQRGSSPSAVMNNYEITYPTSFIPLNNSQIQQTMMNVFQEKTANNGYTTHLDL